MRLSEVTKLTVKQVALEFQSALLDEFDDADVNLTAPSGNAPDVKLEMKVTRRGQLVVVTVRMFAGQDGMHVVGSMSPYLRGNRLIGKTDYRFFDNSMSVLLPDALSTGESVKRLTGGWPAVARAFAHEVAARLS